MKLTNFIILISIVTLFFFVDTAANCLHHHEPNQIKKGHLALPTSQETSPLYAFGQNIVDKGDLQLFLYSGSLIGNANSFTEVDPSLLYGITNELSLFVELSIAAKFDQCGRSSSGLGDLLAQLEYSLYEKDSMTATNQITLVGGAILPTGKALIFPSTGFGAPGFFIGATASHMGADWYVFTSQGGIITTEHKKTKFGNAALYQFGISRSVGNRPGWIFAPMLELFGIYTQRPKIKGRLDLNSGGNSFFIGPSIWIASERLIVQAGVAFVVAEHLFGRQPASHFFPAADIGWKF